MPAHKKNREDDRRGAPAGDQTKPKGNRRAGTAHEGKMGNVPHQRNEDAARLVKMLKGYGMTLEEISDVVGSQYRDQGYSISTLQRHYQEEIHVGMSQAKANLLQNAHKKAFMQELPAGVSHDKAYEIAAKKEAWLLQYVHGVGGHDLGSGNVTIQISQDDAEL